MSEVDLEPYEKEIRDTFYREISAIPSDEIQVTADYKEHQAARQILELRPLNPNRSPLYLSTDGDEVVQMGGGMTAYFEDWPKDLPPSMDLIEAFIRAVLHGGITETQWLFRGRILFADVTIIFDEYGVKRTGIPMLTHFWSDLIGPVILYPLGYLLHMIEKKTIVYEPYITK